MTTQQHTATQARQHITTEELAALLGLKPQSLRKRVCNFGSYFGLSPLKLASGRLLWPANAIELLAVGA